MVKYWYVSGALTAALPGVFDLGQGVVGVLAVSICPPIGRQIEFLQLETRTDRASTPSTPCPL